MNDTPMFLSDAETQQVQRDFGTPTFVYDEAAIRRRVAEALAYPNAYGLTVRYAMKACPTRAILRTLHQAGLHIDASSGYEAERAMKADIPGEHIQLTAQELPKNLGELLDAGVLFNACSLHQLRAYGELRPHSEISVRMNPGLGSGHSNRTNVGGPSSSFGIWHEHLDDIEAIRREYDLRITRMHTHIGSGADPETWNRCAQLSLAIAGQLPDVTLLSLGGGFKVGRMPDEATADLQSIGQIVKADFEAFATEHGRKLHLEIEPGSFFLVNSGLLVCTIIDVVDTGDEGYAFLKVDAGMTEITRPSLYGAQHPLHVVPVMPGERGSQDYLVVGHCCESGDVLTPEPGNPEGLQTRNLTEARIGDLLVVSGAGAYCASMCTKNYNSFPEAAEVMRQADGSFACIRRRQTLDQSIQNEL